MIIYPKCSCDLHTSCHLSSFSLCECLRQSILYVEQSITNETITVERLGSILAGHKMCQFKINFQNL